MTSIGDTLRRERLRRGWDLGKVATETKIGLHLLEAIEADEFERLPGGVFAKSFVRQYARLLGLDEEELGAELKQQFTEPAEPIPVTEPEHSAVNLPRLAALEDFRDRVRSDSSISALVWVVIAIFACAGVYTLWQTRRAASATSKVETAAAASPAPVSPSPAPPPSPMAQPASLSKTPSPAAAEPPKSDFRAAEISDSGTIKAPAVPAPPPEPQKNDTPVSAAPQTAGPAAVRVAFNATQPVWVSIKSDGNRTFTGTLEPNQVKQLEASRKITVLIGNAGGLKITLNGKPVRSLGDDGEIRLLVLTPQGAHVVPRTPPTPPPTSDGSTAPAAAADVRP